MTDYWITTRAGVPVGLRGPLVSDLPYVMRSWLLGVRTSDTHRRTSDAVFFAAWRPVVERLWADGSLLRAVACDVDDPAYVLGFVCGDPDGPVLHYLHVDGSVRRQGLATALLGLLGLRREDEFPLTMDAKDARRLVRRLTLRPELLERRGP